MCPSVGLLVALKDDNSLNKHINFAIDVFAVFLQAGVKWRTLQKILDSKEFHVEVDTITESYLVFVVFFCPMNYFFNIYILHINNLISSDVKCTHHHGSTITKFSLSTLDAF